MEYKINKMSMLLIVLFLFTILTAQESPIRVGTTAANFLELGYDPRGTAMGDAVVSTVDNLSSIYWNPAGLAYMGNKEAYFAVQPWLVNTYTYFAAAGINLPSIGSFAAGIMGINYGEMEVTTLDLQEGTGENFTPIDIAVNASYGKLLTNWFAFGATVKYIYSSIYHCNAQAVALDIGTIIQTNFFSSSKDSRKGLKIGMSLSNYGTRLRYTGLDLLRSLDIAPDQAGNYKDVQVEFKTDSWELPLIFRIGASLTPILLTNQKLTLAVNALHVNNNSESVNLGAEYTIGVAGLGSLAFRAGYRGLFMEDSEFGPTLGLGIIKHLSAKSALQFDYAYRDIGILGNVNVMGLSVSF